jgi:hypothetical protein
MTVHVDAGRLAGLGINAGAFYHALRRVGDGEPAAAVCAELGWTFPAQQYLEEVARGGRVPKQRKMAGMPEPIYELRCWPEHFKAISEGRKTFDVRRDDRGFKVGDVVTFHAWDPSSGAYVAGEDPIECRIAHVLALGDVPGLGDLHRRPDRWVVLGLGRPLPATPDKGAR